MADIDYDSFFMGFGTPRLDLDHNTVLSLFKRDKALQAIVDTIVGEGNEEELCRAADLYFFEGVDIHRGDLYDIGFSFSEFVEVVEKEQMVEALLPVFDFDMRAESAAVLGRLFFIGNRESVKKRLEYLY